jgi:hypothetical protein
MRSWDKARKNDSKVVEEWIKRDPANEKQERKNAVARKYLRAQPSCCWMGENARAEQRDVLCWRPSIDQ